MILNVISFNIKIPIKKGEYKKHVALLLNNSSPKRARETLTSTL